MNDRHQKTHERFASLLDACTDNNVTLLLQGINRLGT